MSPDVATAWRIKYWSNLYWQHSIPFYFFSHCFDKTLRAKQAHNDIPSPLYSLFSKNKKPLASSNLHNPKAKYQVKTITLLCPVHKSLVLVILSKDLPSSKVLSVNSTFSKVPKFCNTERHITVYSQLPCIKELLCFIHVEAYNWLQIFILSFTYFVILTKLLTCLCFSFLNFKIEILTSYGNREYIQNFRSTESPCLAFKRP